jgi:hypothetical protein
MAVSFLKIRNFFVFFLFGGLAAFSAQAVAPENQILALDDLHYPAAIYQPDASKGTGDMIVAFSKKKAPKDLVEEWQAAAKKKGLHVLAVAVDLKDGEMPTHIDKWVLNLKKEMILRYRVKRLYLLGYDERAHYVSYFGLRHPHAFTAYAAIGSSWAGPFDKIVKPTDEARKQAPFFVALTEKDKNLGAAQLYAGDLTKKGYDVRLVVLDRVGEESSDPFLQDLISWFNEQHRKRESAKNRPKRFKEKVSTAVEEFFQVN